MKINKIISLLMLLVLQPSFGMNLEPSNQAPEISLLQAAEEGDLATVMWHLSHGANINKTNLDKESPIALAASKGNKEIVIQLINAGANLNLRNVDGETALHLAVSQKHWPVVKELIAAGADVNIKDHEGMTVLMKSARNGKDDIVGDLINAGARIEYKDRKGNTAFSYAKMSRRPAVIELLNNALMQGNNAVPIKRVLVPQTFSEPLVEKTGEEIIVSPEPSSVESLSEVPTIKAATLITTKESKNISKLKPVPIKEKKGHKRTKNTFNDKAGNTSLVNAGMWGDITAVQQLLNKGIDINGQDDRGDTVLAVASSFGKIEVVKLLLKLGANPNTANKSGDAPLHNAVRGGHIQVARLLLDAGANVNARDTFHSRTALNWVVRMTVGAVKKIAPQNSVEKSVEMAKLLLSYGADPSIVDDKHKTPLQWAQEIGATPLVKVLEKN